MDFRPHGILPAMITPLKENGSVNIPALRGLIRHLLAGDVHGIFTIGSTGEFYGLSQAEYREILEATVDEVDGKVPVYAGCNAITTRAAVELAGIAEETGVDALSVLTPMFISPSQDQLYLHFEDIAASTSLPVLLYDNAPRTGVRIMPGTAQRLAKLDNVVGIKDSTGDLTNTGEYIRLTREENFHVMMGRDTLIYAALTYGAVGGVAACANVAPKLVSDIYRLYQEGDHKGALEAQYRLAPLRLAFALGTFPAVIKEALELLGIEAGPCFAPVGPLSEEERGKLRSILEEMGILQ